MHKHKCPKSACGYVWEHNPDCLDTHEKYDAAHLCPRCGTEQRYKYDGDLSAKEDNSGFDCPTILRVRATRIREYNENNSPDPIAELLGLIKKRAQQQQSRQRRPNRPRRPVN